MRKHCFNIVLTIIFLTNVLFITTNAQTISKETAQKFKAVSVACGDKALLTFHATPDRKSVEEQAIRFKSAEEAKKRSNSYFLKLRKYSKNEHHFEKLKTKP